MFEYDASYQAFRFSLFGNAKNINGFGMIQ